MTYHDESYNEQMEAQFGPYDSDPPLQIDAREVDAALGRIERAAATFPIVSMYWQTFRTIIAEERARLGLPMQSAAL